MERFKEKQAGHVRFAVTLSEQWHQMCWMARVSDAAEEEAILQITVETTGIVRHEDGKRYCNGGKDSVVTHNFNTSILLDTEHDNNETMISFSFPFS